MYQELRVRMEKERKLLALMIRRYGICHEKTIKQSEMLDKLIVDYLKETQTEDNQY